MGAPVIDRSKPWKARASSAGYYMKCMWRAAQDRLIHEGRLDPSQKTEQDDTSYADLGTCIHFTLQDGTRSRFPGDPKDFAPTQAEWESASKLFGRDMDLTRRRVRDSAALAATMLPKSPDGMPWRSEDEFENEILTGHTDFLSEDRTILGDLKSTSKPPPNGRIKYEHLVQVVGYHLLVPTTQRAFVLYVDSQRAGWATLIWVNFMTPSMQFFIERVREFCVMVMGDHLLNVAYPNLGPHCSDSWCGYKRGCHDTYMPGPGAEFNAALRRPTGMMRLGPIAAA